MRDHRAVPVSPYPCHIFSEADIDEAGKSFEVKPIKSYGPSVNLKNGRKLHDNFHFFNGETGERHLVRCKKCGALLLQQTTNDWDFYDGPNFCYDWIPVASEEEADLLTILLDGEAFEKYPFRHLRKYNFTFIWTGGAEPAPQLPEELKARIMQTYLLTSMDEVRFNEEEQRL